MSTKTFTLATVANMKEAETRGKHCFAFSPFTFEQFSATSGDYWGLGDDEPLIDSEGNPMFLGVKVTRYIDALTGADLLSDEGAAS